MLTASLVSALLLTGTTPALRVEISSPKTSLLVFEPVKITVRATANQAVSIPPISDTSGSPAMETWVDYGSGFVEYVDEPRQMGYGVGGASLQAGESLVRTVVLVEGRIGDQPTVPFPAPGLYSLRVLFRARPDQDGVSGVVLGESNAITFEVVAPDAQSQSLVQRVRNEPWILRGGLGNPEYDDLVRDFPWSPYLHWGKRAIALGRINRIGNGEYPESGDEYAEIGQGHPLTPQLYRQLADELRDGSTWGQFDEERLRLAAENLGRAGDFAEAKTVWQEILERFPGSEAAEEAKSRIDTTPPSLQLAASPPMLWPPSHNLEPITVAVTVTDDVDPNPSVILVSIVCEDSGAQQPGQKGQGQRASQGCDDDDIADAAYGTDDREFRLRSQRVGFGTGRVYTITYEATDAAGNTTTAATTVTAAHDQGMPRER